MRLYQLKMTSRPKSVNLQILHSGKDIWSCLFYLDCVWQFKSRLWFLQDSSVSAVISISRMRRTGNELLSHLETLLSGLCQHIQGQLMLTALHQRVWHEVLVEWDSLILGSGFLNIIYIFNNITKVKFMFFAVYAAYLKLKMNAPPFKCLCKVIFREALY